MSSRASKELDLLNAPKPPPLNPELEEASEDSDEGAFIIDAEPLSFPSVSVVSPDGVTSSPGYPNQYMSNSKYNSHQSHREDEEDEEAPPPPPPMFDGDDTDSASDSVYACGDCDKSYATAQLLARHVKLRHSEARKTVAVARTTNAGAAPVKRESIYDSVAMPKVFSCTKCAKSYETEELLARHTKLRHAEEEEEDDDDSLPGYAPVMASEERVAHRCADCGKSYPEKRLLDRHRMLRHPPPDLEFACDECEKSYETSELLARHKKLRHDDADGSLLPYSSPKIKPGDLSGKARGRGRGGRGRGPGRGLAAGGTGRVGRASGRGDFESLGKRKPAAPSVDYRPFWMILVSVIDVVLLAWEIDEEGGILPFGLNPMFGPSGETLKRLGAKYTPYILDGQAWRIFTPMFLHVGIVHLLFNLFFSLRIGLFLEKQHGYFRIMPIYLLCGLHGNILSAIFLPGVASVGASSALFGFYGIMIADLLQNWEDIHRPGRSFAGLILQILVSLVIGLLPGIDNFAHIGGLIMGIASGFVFIPSMSKSFSARRALAVSMAAICVGLLFLIELSALFSGRPSTEWCPTCSLINCLPILNWCEDPNAIFADLSGGLPV